MFKTPMAVAVLTVFIPQSSNADVLDEIWQAWQAREKQCGTIRMEYTSHGTRTLEDMRAIDQGYTTVHFAPDGRMLSETVLKETANTHGKLGQGTVVDLVHDDFRLHYAAAPKRASLSQRAVGMWQPTEVAMLYQVMCPTASAIKAAHNVEPKTDVEGTPCLVVSRSHENSNGSKATVTLYLREELGFLPMRATYESRSGDTIELKMTTKIHYDQVDGVYVPKVWMIDELRGINTRQALNLRTTALRTRVQLNAEFAPANFQVQVAAGTTLTDRRRGNPAPKEVLTETRTFGAVGAQ